MRQVAAHPTAEGTPHGPLRVGALEASRYKSATGQCATCVMRFCQGGGRWRPLGVLLGKLIAIMEDPVIEYALSDASCRSSCPGKFDKDPRGAGCPATFAVAVVTRPTQHGVIPVIGERHGKALKCVALGAGADQFCL